MLIANAVFQKRDEAFVQKECKEGQHCVGWQPESTIGYAQTNRVRGVNGFHTDITLQHTHNASFVNGDIGDGKFVLRQDAAEFENCQEVFYLPPEQLMRVATVDCTGRDAGRARRGATVVFQVGTSVITHHMYREIVQC